MNENMKKVLDAMERTVKLQEAYNMMEEAGNEEGKNAIRMAFEAFNEEMQKLDEEISGFGFIYRVVKTAKECGNELIDICEPIHFISEEELAEAFKAFGIEKFTMSSTWSSAIEVAYKFDKAGYKVSGITEINDRFEDFHGNRKMIPALMFELQ